MHTVVFADVVGSTGLYERLGDVAASHFVSQVTMLMSQVFEQQRGRIVKLLGDGILVLFQTESEALTASMAVQRTLRERHMRPTPTANPVQVQLGIDSGDVVEIDGDCFGDTVNSAARLADLAGADQILTTQSVYGAVAPAQRAQLHSIGPMQLRGKAQLTQIYRVEWLQGREEEVTMMVTPLNPTQKLTILALKGAGRTVKLLPGNARITLGRSPDAAIMFNDRGVSRAHATVEYRGGHFVITDTSSFGTWVYLGGQPDAMVLRRNECFLIGSGQIVLGCDRDEPEAPLIEFSLHLPAQ